MLVIKCAKCKNKIIRYKKIGKGSVLKVYIDRITKWYLDIHEDNLICHCGNQIGIKKEDYYKMIQGSFTTTGKAETR